MAVPEVVVLEVAAEVAVVPEVAVVLVVACRAADSREKMMILRLRS